MAYKGRRTFNEIKMVRLVHAERMGKFCERWGDHYAGIPACHPSKLYGIISEILTENPQIKGIIEIGTFCGALSCYLGAECVERDYKPLYTFDDKIRYIPKLFKNLGINFVVDDCFSKKSIKIIKDYVKDTPILFICDGGFKTKEFNAFAPLLPVGSVIGVHDWNIEVNMESIGKTVDSLKMSLIKEEQWSNPPDYILMAWFFIPERR